VLIATPNRPEVVELFSEVMESLASRDTSPWGMYTREFVRKTHEWTQSTQQVKDETATAYESDPTTLLFDHLHQVAFRQGLGNPLYAAVDDVAPAEALNFATQQFGGNKVTMLGVGVSHDDFAESAEHFAGSLQNSAASTAQPAKYFGGEHFDASRPASDVHYALGFSGASLASDYFAATVLQQLLGGSGQGGLKYGANHSLLAGVDKADAQTFSFNYSDAGLFGVYLKSDQGANVADAAKKTVQVLKEVAAGRFGEHGEAAVKRAVEVAKMSVASQFESAPRLAKVQSYGAQVR
jgi:ubiquinol-cytochrome c reductase core subunit 2